MFKTGYVSYGVLAQYSTVFGKPMDKDDFISRLYAIDIKMAIATISRLISLHWAVIRKDKDAEELLSIIRTAYGCQVFLCGGNETEYYKSDAVFCPQTLYVLIKWFLVYGHEKEPLRPLSLEDFMQIFNLSLAVNDLLPSDDVDGSEVDYLNVNLYHNTPNMPFSQMGRSYYIYRKIMTSMKQTKQYIDTFKTKNRFSLDQYFAEIFNLLSINYCINWDIASFCAFNLAFDNTNPDVKLLQPIHNDFIRSTVTTNKKAQEIASRTLEDIWDFEIFYRCPLISFDNSIFSISDVTLLYLIDEGLYWRIRFQDRDEVGVNFMRDYGKAFEKYIQFATETALTYHSQASSYLLEFEYFYHSAPYKSTDAYIRIGNWLLAIEAKAESPHSSVLKGYNHEQLRTEAEALIVAPTKQADRRFLELLSGDVDWRDNNQAREFFAGVTNICIICVSRVSIQPVGELLYCADEKLKCRDDNGDKIKTPMITNYFNMDISDYEALLDLIQKGVDVPRLLSEWFVVGRAEKYTVIPFRSFIISRGLEYRCPDKLSTIFHKEFDELRVIAFGEGTENIQK